MSFLPIVERELRVAARRPATHRLRFFAALAVMLVWFALALGSQRYSRPAALGQHLFNALGVLGLGFSLLAGVFLTADCLSVEKREGTLGLLFLTDLRGFDVVLGKLAATSLQAIFALLAVLPMMALPVLLGGVTGGEFTRLIVVLLATLLFSLSLGMAVSALGREAAHTMLATFLILLAVAGGLPTLSGLLYALNVADFHANPLSWPSPVSAYILVFDAYYRVGRCSLYFWGSIATMAGLGLAALLLACHRLRDFQDAAAGAAPTALRRRGLASPTQRRRLEQNPFEWLACRGGRFRRMAMRTLVVLLIPWLGCLGLTLASSRMMDFGFGVCLFGAYVVHLVAKCFVAVEASRRFSADRASGVLELLLVTPLPVPAILEGQRRALRQFARGPVLICLFVNLALIWLLWGPDPLHMGRETLIFTELFVGGMVVLLLDVFALGWVGMETGLRHPRQHRAVLATLGKVMLAPWIGIFLFVFLSMGGLNWNEQTIARLFAVWLLAGAGLSVILGSGARSRLQARFRQLVSGATSSGPKPYAEVTLASQDAVPA